MTPRAKAQKSALARAGTLFFSILSLALSATLPASTPVARTGYSDAGQIPPAVYVIVHFAVQAPQPPQQSQQLKLVLLDDIGGVEVSHSYSMQMDGPLSFSLSLPFQQGSLIHYRYASGGETEIQETGTDGSQAVDRWLSVVGNMEMDDRISAWQGQPERIDQGVIVGTISEGESRQPLPGIVVSCNGASTFTASDGAFVLAGLPVGECNLVAFSPSGEYSTFQQRASVKAEMFTQANFSLRRQSMTQLSIVAHLQPGEKLDNQQSLRMVTNLPLIGASGLSHFAMLSPSPGQDYFLRLSLPVGFDLHYRFTTGNAIWGTEHDVQGGSTTHEIIVPQQPAVVEDWVGPLFPQGIRPVTVHLQAPPETPAKDILSIQPAPFGKSWETPIPMTRLEDGTWALSLSPSQASPSEITYRFCRNSACGGEFTSSQQAAPTDAAVLNFLPTDQSIDVIVTKWSGLSQPKSPTPVFSSPSSPRGTDFVAGMAFQPNYSPDYAFFLESALTDASSLHANWVLFTPTWSFDSPSFPSIGAQPGLDPSWQDVSRLALDAEARGFRVALIPRILLRQAMPTSWTPQDYTEMASQLNGFLIHFADLANQTNAAALVLSPPQTLFLPEGNPFAEQLATLVDPQWQALLPQVRSRYKGEIWAALPFSSSLPSAMPQWAISSDRLLLLWAAPVAHSAGGGNDIQEFTPAFSRLLEETVRPLRDGYALPIIIALNYPSAPNASQGCAPLPEACLGFQPALSPEAAVQNSAVSQSDLDAQRALINAAALAINDQPWVSGLVTYNNLLPLRLQDASANLRGKPGADVLAYWFSLWMQTP